MPLKAEGTYAVNAQTADLQTEVPAQKNYAIQKWTSIPFFLVHAATLLAFYTGVGIREVVVCVALYYIRMFAITAGYHRYFAHRAYQTNRVFQFLIALLGTTAAQKGPLWWAAHHRHHHRTSDQPDDIHSPVQDTFWWSHVGWILSDRYDATHFDAIKDFARYPELRFLNRFHLLPTIALAVGLYFWGGLSMLVWGYFISTVLLWHGTFTINSLSHVFGKRRYKSSDDSRNNWLLAIITCGEGWHNNHHYHQNTANQGWFWWEVDFSYYLLKFFSLFGLVTKLRLPPENVKLAHLKYTAEERAALNAPGRKTAASIAADLAAAANARAAAAAARAAGIPPVTHPEPSGLAHPAPNKASDMMHAAQAKASDMAHAASDMAHAASARVTSAVAQAADAVTRGGAQPQPVLKRR